MGVPLKTIKKPPVCISYMPCAIKQDRKPNQNKIHKQKKVHRIKSLESCHVMTRHEENNK